MATVCYDVKQSINPEGSNSRKDTALKVLCVLNSPLALYPGIRKLSPPLPRFSLYSFVCSSAAQLLHYCMSSTHLSMVSPRHVHSTQKMATLQSTHLGKQVASLSDFFNAAQNSNVSNSFPFLYII